MNEQRLSQRLGKVAAYVPKGSRLADIGSDHAYLPAYLILNGQIEFAVAGEVVKGPYESAKKLVKELVLEDRITVRLADGLEAIQPQDNIDTITIAGMGGTLISEILERGQRQGILSGQEMLILQPNVGEKNVREWLVHYGYSIIHEEILKEDGKIYEIIVSKKVEVPSSYTKKDMVFGPFLRQNKNEVFREKWQREQKQKEEIVAQLTGNESKQLKKRDEFHQLISWIEEEL